MANPLDQSTDRELIERAQAGSMPALETLIRRYLQTAYSVCFHYLKNTEDAQDAAQQTFVKVWKHVKKINPSQDVGAWIAEISKNTALDMLKKKKAIPFSAFDRPGHEQTIAQTVASEAPAPDTLAQRSLEQERLQTAMAQLSPGEQHILTLSQEGFSLREIAEKIHKPLETVKSRYRRSLAKLKKIIGQY